MDTSLQRFYEGSPITFNVGNDGTMVNATEMAKPFGKRPVDWLKYQHSKTFLDALSKVRNITLEDLVKTNKGGDFPGTWINEDVALEFARWLSPEFGIWCNDQIKEMLKTGFTAMNREVLQEYNKLQELEQAKEQRLIWSRKVRRLKEDIELIREKRFLSTVPNYQPRVNSQSETKQYSLF